MSRVSERDNATGDESPGSDLAAILHDDEFIESILRGGEVPAESDAEAELAVLFSGARHQIVSTPMPGMPSEDELAAALASGIEEAGAGTVVPLRRSRRYRWMTTVTAGAASVAVLLGGIAVAGHFLGADEPVGQSSEDFVTAASIRDELAHAKDLLAKGDLRGCLAVLDSATEKMEKIRGDSAFTELDDTRTDLWAQATGRPKSEAPAVGADVVVPPPAPTSTATPPPSSPPPPSIGIEGVPGLPDISVPLPQIQLPPLPDVQLPQLPLQQAPAPNPPTTTTPAPTTTPTTTPTETPAPSSSADVPPPGTATPTPTPGPQKQQLSDLDGN
ncbi:anti-sigma-D factor RsdA [Tomitella cavernea]|uniref:anti-sigma-D factor RsdA n=1 Tax=Tomitella cavernea TaxID=1387982 RepID=UPI0019085294|nr:anti-sigma-D factor RsdA [Tomitella cavernea]